MSYYQFLHNLSFQKMLTHLINHLLLSHRTRSSSMVTTFTSTFLFFMVIMIFITSVIQKISVIYRIITITTFLMTCTTTNWGAGVPLPCSSPPCMLKRPVEPALKPTTGICAIGVIELPLPKSSS